MYTILYVDDEPDLLEIAKIFFERSEDFSVDTTDSAKKALETLKQHHYDAILSDFQMPGMNGITFLKEVRSTYGDIPFIIFTGRGREEVVIDALNNGADFYLQKGGDPETLYTELMHVTRRTIQMRQANVSLAEQEQRFHDLQNANDLIQSVTPDGHFLFVNKKWQDTLGYDERDLGNLTIFDIIHEESMKHCQELFPRVIAGENVGIIDVVFKTRDGKKVYAEGLATCKITDGQPQYTRGIFKDVTDRKKTETALRESEERYRTLYKDNPIMLFTLDPDGNVISVNTAGASTLGYTANELEGQSVLKVFYPDDQSAVTEQLQLCVNSPGEGFHWQFRKVKKDGSLIWVDEYARSMMNPSGILCVLVVCQDITDRKRAEEALIRSEKKYRNIIENIQDVFYRTDRNGKLIMFSPHGVKLAGYNSEEEMIGLDVAQDTYKDPKARERFLAALAEKGFVENYPLVLKTKTGNPRIVTTSSHFYYDDQGNVLGVEGIIHDVTELKEKEKELRASEEKYRTLVEYTLDGILILDPEGKILFANQAAGRLIGATKYSEMIGVNNVLEFIAPESKADAVRDFRQVAQGIDGYLAQYKIITTHRQERWVESIGKRIIFEGKPAIHISLRDITERQHAGIVIQESENKFRTIFENSPYPISINSIPDGRFIEINAAFLNACGYTEEEILGKTPMEIRLLSLADFGNLTSRLLLAGRLENVPMALRVKGDKQVHVLVSVIPVTINDQSAIMTVAAEVTQLKRVEAELLRKNEDLNAAYEQITATDEELRANYDALSRQEQALRESEEKYRLLTEATNDIIYMIDAEGTVTHISPQISRYGYRPEDVLSRNFTEFLEKEDVAKAVADLERTISTRQPTVTLLRIRDKEGNLHWMEDNGSPVVDSAGSVVAISGILRDVTERLRAEEALRESEEKFRALVENSLEAVLITDFTGTLLFANQAAGRIVDAADYQAMIGKKNVLEFVSPESQADVLHDFSQVMQGIDAYLVHYKLITETKREVWVECIGKKILFGGSTAMLVSMRDVTERRKTEDVLKASEARFRTLFEISPDGIILFDLAGRITYASPEALRMFRVPSMDEAIGTSVFDWVDPECHERVREAMVQLLDGKIRHEIIYRVRRRDGESFFAETGQGIFPDANGRPDGFLVIIRDISGRKKAEEVLRESENKFATVFRSSPVSLTLVSATDGTFVDVNDAFLRLTGYTREDMIGKTSEILGFFVERRERERMESTLRKHQHMYGMEMQCRNKSGEIGTCRFTSGLILMNGKPHILSTVEDITERKQVADAVRESEEFLNAIVENIPDMVFVKDADELRFVRFNKAGEELLGYSRQDMYGKNDYDFFPEHEADFFTSKDREVLSSGQMMDIPEEMLLTRNKGERILHTKKIPVPDEKGKPRYLLGISEDITERKVTESAFQAMVRSMVGTTGLDSLKKIAETVSSWLAAECVMIGEIQLDKKTVKVLSMLLDGKDVKDFSYTLKDTPCENASEKGFCLYPDNVREFFPKAKDLVDLNIRGYVGTSLRNSEGDVIGILCALSRNPLKPIPAMQEIMEVIGTKAAAEIERAGIEHALRESEEKFRTLVEHSLDGILIVDMTGTILFRNRAAAKVVGSEGTSDQDGAKNVMAFIAPESRASVLKDISQVAQGIDAYPVSYKAITITGKPIWVEGIGKRIVFQDSPAILVSLRDISSRKRMEDAILRTNKQLSLLSSVTRHDVLNKISVIQGHIALARKRGSQQDYPALLDKITSTTNIIKSQLEFSRIYQNLGTKEPEWQKPKKLLTSIHLPDSVILKNEVGELEIYADLMLEKVFQNLADNSVRHGGNITEISVQSRKDPDGLTILFEDNGIGIPADEKDAIFERGYGKNTGLGLFLAREILGITGMTIRETGEAGKGAQFEIHVPDDAYRIAHAKT